jgi:hypothetical protein
VLDDPIAALGCDIRLERLTVNAGSAAGVLRVTLLNMSAATLVATAAVYIQARDL